jgi:acyl-CoA dehydrogenase
MDFSLSNEQRDWQMKARKFTEEVIVPASLRCDQTEGGQEPWDWDVIEAGSKLGFRTLPVPKEWGGPGADFISQAIVMMELAKGDSAICKAFTQNWKWAHQMSKFCSEDQKERFLKPFLADHRYVMGRGMTEAVAGSDNKLPPEDDPTAGSRLTAVRDGDEWILNGEKIFIANGTVGSRFFLAGGAGPTPQVREGSTLFIVPKDTPGFRIGRVFNKRGWRFYQNAELIFEDARVPHKNVLGEVGIGKPTAVSLGGGDLFGDLELGSNAVGVCDAAVEMATTFAKKHKKAGRLLFDHQITQHKLTEMHMLTEALRSFVMRGAWEHEEGIKSGVPALSLNYSSDVIQRVTRLNLDIHGTAGHRMNARADKLVRDAMIWTHLAGDTVQRLRTLQRVK